MRFLLRGNADASENGAHDDSPGLRLLQPSRAGEAAAQADQAAPVIRIRGITKVYRMGDNVVNALRGVDLDIPRGELVGLMGPSGSGKSTLMNIIGCLDQPTSGTYELDGIETSSMTDDDLAWIRNHKIGFVFQTFNLLPRVPAVEQVELPLLYAGVHDRRRRALESLEAVGLVGRAHHKPSELSGGQQQRVAIARALVTNPAIILADEPTGNLDTRSSEEIMQLVQELHRDRGITIVAVTHEPDIASHMQRIIRIRDGRIDRDEKVERPVWAADVIARLKKDDVEEKEIAS